MKSMIFAAVMWLAQSPAFAEPSEIAPSKPVQTNSEDFFDAHGHLIGSLTMIGNVSYFTTPDGKVIGVAKVVDGRRVYRSY